MNRRSFIKLAASLAAAPGLPVIGHAGPRRIVEYRLEAGAGTSPIVGGGYPETAVFHYNQLVPGPEIRIRRGDRLRVTVNNALDQETTVHWHGIRLPNAMDGVPHLTQPPIPPGGNFVYEFEPPDAGTYWYHPHVNSSEQVGRGLYGALIVEEPETPDASAAGRGFDRETVWILDDWRLDNSAAIQPFGSGHDASHAGRIGNVVTINGRLPEPLEVRTGERLRLRLINAANARHFSLLFEELAPRIIAIDGQPVTPHQPDSDGMVLAPAQRIDLLLDVTSAPGKSTRIIDTFYRDAYLLNDIVSLDAEPLPGTRPEYPGLASNSLPEPDLETALTHDILFAGGAMGGMSGALVNGDWTDIRTMARSGVVWALNGIAATGHVMDPMMTLERGRSYILSMRNDTAFPHPIHLHGHHFRVISRDGVSTRYGEWQDTVLMKAGERVDVAFVADNPGDWMFHCHIPEHMEAGMTGVIRVA